MAHDPAHTVDPHAKPGEPGTLGPVKNLRDHDSASSHNRLTEQTPVRQPDGQPGESENHPNPTDSPTHPHPTGGDA
jgi:hypothetical protein